MTRPPLVCACVSVASVALAAATPLWPRVRVHLAIATSSLSPEGDFAPGYRQGPLPPFSIFAFSLAAAVLAAAVDALNAARPAPASTWRRVAEAFSAALGAAAAYTALGGCLLASAALAAVLAFVSALSDGTFLLLLSLAAVLWDAAFVAAPHAWDRLAMAITYAGYSAALELHRAGPTESSMAPVITTAMRVSALWQAYAVLAGETAGAGPPNAALYLATVLPAGCVLLFTALANPHAGAAAALPQSPHTPERHRKVKRRHARHEHEGAEGQYAAFRV